ncbi:hypothetical protein C7H19_15145 [Aphanothece hegewaldii CCALA 016]|uniref:Uncharacterized protein n=1 Tax=Aphanothece hegewaldii CCALA 016 TaxID=2107694 RepID=A0A2T1LVT7_9CHRO|nr:hypothetical protein [Aphanothece hegewaldii]PSF35760.1 hypothetical protein C7H19_15145 [Aphanothece hegewaldii CCALA 016]
MDNSQSIELYNKINNLIRISREAIALYGETAPFLVEEGDYTKFVSIKLSPDEFTEVCASLSPDGVLKVNYTAHYWEMENRLLMANFQTIFPVIKLNAEGILEELLVERLDFCISELQAILNGDSDSKRTKKWLEFMEYESGF